MPPRRSARVAAAVEHRTCALAPLPLALAQLIFSLVPVDSRARASCVCRGWRAVLADPALWSRLDLSDESGIAEALDTDALLRGAVARARVHGQGLYRLDVSGLQRITPGVLLAVLAANAGSLRELRVNLLYLDSGEPLATLKELVAAAPLLRVLDASVSCDWEVALRLMRPEPPLTPLRLSELEVLFGTGIDDVYGLERVGPFAAALADASLHPELTKVLVCDVDTQQPQVLDALVDAALARRLRSISFCGCSPPAAVPLARLLTGGALTDLEWCFGANPPHAPLFNAAGAALVADALRATTALQSLRVSYSHLCDDMVAAETLLGALVRHPSLRRLVLLGENLHNDSAALGAALAALVAADAPALLELYVAGNALGDAGLGPLVDALPHNRHLRVLNIRYNRISERFARERLLPAVRANAGLRELSGGEERNAVWPAVAEAQELVKSRPS
jgi:hypothetical protein